MNMLSTDNCPTSMSTYKEDTQMIRTTLGSNLVKLEDIHGENNGSMYVYTYNDTCQLDSMMYSNLCETYAQQFPYKVFNYNATPELDNMMYKTDITYSQYIPSEVNENYQACSACSLQGGTGHNQT